MSKKNKPDKNGFVFSTDPSFRFNEEPEEIQETLPHSQQKLQIKYETRNRGGKAVTLVLGFIGTDEDLQALGKKLKNFCGTGGSVKDGEIIIQGDQREKMKVFLEKEGFKNLKI